MVWARNLQSGDDYKQAMDLIMKSYGFIEGDEAEEARGTELKSSTNTETRREDYLGLCDSDDDSSEDLVPRDPSRTVDTLIDAYQLNETGFGPEARPEYSDSQPEAHRKTKRLKWDVSSKNSVLVNHDSSPISSISDNETHENDTSESVFGTNCQFVTHTPSSSSSLPKSLKWKLTDHRSCVNTLHWGRSPFSHLLLSASMDGTVRIWDALERPKCVWNSETRLRSLQKSAVRCARWDSTGRLIAIGGYDKTARVVDVDTGVEIFSGVHRNVVNCLWFHPIESQAMVCGTDGRIECWDTRERRSRPVRSYSGDFGEIQDLLFLKDGSEFISCSNLVTRDSADKTIMAWDYRTGAVLSNQIFQERYHCTCLRTHPSNNWFVAQTNGNYVALFSASRPYRMNKKKRYEGHEVEGYWIGCDISPDGQFVYSGSADGFLYAYSFWKGSRLTRFRITDVPLLAIEAHPFLQSRIAVSDMKGVIHIWQ